MKYILVLVSVTIACCGRSAPLPDVKVGVLTDEIREIAANTSCTSTDRVPDTGEVLTEVRPLHEVETTSFHDYLRRFVKRLDRKRLIGLTCEPGGMVIVLAPEDGSIYVVLTSTVKAEQALRWLDALQRAGLDAGLVELGRGRIRANGEGDDLKTSDGSIRMTVRNLDKGFWSLSVVVQR